MHWHCGQTAVASQRIGVGAVLVQAKDAAAKGFYQACAEFPEYSAESPRWVLPIELVVAGFG